jgi:hypothetical protein
MLDGESFFRKNGSTLQEHIHDAASLFATSNSRIVVSAGFG